MVEEEILKVAEFLLKNRLKTFYIYGITIDLTYVNKYYGYDVGNVLKEGLLEIISENEPFFIKVVGGKVIFFLLKKFEKKEIENLEKKFSNKYNLRRLIYLVEREIEIPGDLYNLFFVLVFIESKLKKIRGLVQIFFKENSEIIEKMKEKEIEELSKIFQLLKTTTIQNVSNQPFISELKSKNKRELFKIVKNSYFLTKALYFLGVDEFEFKKYVISYFLYLYSISVIGELYKREKIKRMIDKKKEEFKFNRKESIEDFKHDLITWYNAVIKPFFPFFNKELKEKSREIEKLINELIQSKEIDKDTEKKLIKEINNFVEKLEIFNLSVPITSKLEVSMESLQYFKRFLYILGENNEKKLNYLLSLFSTYGKKNFNILFEGKEEVIKEVVFKFVNFLFNTKNISSISIDAAFLELDGFNAFNFYIFPNEVDTIYSKILNTFFETAYSFTNKYFKDLKKKIEIFPLIFALGDEFYLFFFSESKVDENLVKDYLKTVKMKIINFVKDKIYPKTEKVKVTLENGEIVVRKLVGEKRLLFFNIKEDLCLTKLGISGIYLHNCLNIKRETLKEYIIKQQILKIKKLLDSCLENIKNSKNKGKLIVKDIHFKI